MRPSWVIKKGSALQCEDCARYDAEQGRCRDGKVNPQRWDQAVDVANLLGVRAICMFNDHREKLVESRVPMTPDMKRTTRLRSR